jgi:uncharacterized protein YdaU (DUF1376 family)
MTDLSNLPTPPIPGDLDVSHLNNFMLDTRRLLTSELVARANGDEFKAAVLLWCHAWQQVPAASLPDNDVVLASFAGFGRNLNGWQRVRAMALHGFIKCSDGRLYHKTLADEAKRASVRHASYAAARKADADRLKRWRDKRQKASEKAGEIDGESIADTSPQIECETVGETRFETVGETRFETRFETRMKRVRDETRRDDKEITRRGGANAPSLSLIVAESDCRNEGAAIQAWNEMADETGVSRVQLLTQRRRPKLRARLAQSGGITGWTSLLEKIKGSKFLRGQNDRGWKVTFDFAINEAGFTKILEGNYDDSKFGMANSSGEALQVFDKLRRRASQGG